MTRRIICISRGNFLIMAAQNNKLPWSTARALEYYNIKGWGQGYFSINTAGHLCVTPGGEAGPVIDVMDVIDEIKEKKLGLPCIVRFQDVLRAQVARLIKAFQKEISESGYSGKYFGVFPIKVNQMREVVEEVLDVGFAHHFGLEAGSKTELLTVLAYNTDPEALTICNGYKDDEYLRLALLGRQLGRKVIVVIEKLSELPRFLALAEEMAIEPLIGIRARLSTQGSGKWMSSGGDFAKFGLTVPEIIQATELLKKMGKSEVLKLFHFHVGSQITDIRIIKDAVNEGARIYAKLVKMGFPIEYFDVGGGLGIDYDGTNTTNDSSVNYTMEAYIADIVYNVKQICADEKVAEPNLVTESGRAVTAHHSLVITNVFGQIQMGQNASDLLNSNHDSLIVERMREIVAGHIAASHSVAGHSVASQTTASNAAQNLLETYHDATAVKEEALSAFKLGILSLNDRAKIEALYWHLCADVVNLQSKLKRVPKELRQLEKQLSNQYLGNFSLFQSAPDHWAFGQLFPVVPLQRLDEEPDSESTIVDITCDSDGKIAQFIDPVASRATLKLHPLHPGQPYYVGMFLLGAYQDIMGDMHNLFGRVNEVHVFVDDEDPEDFYIEEIIRGDSSADVLKRVQYNPEEMLKIMKKALDDRVKSGALKPKHGVNLVDFYEAALNHYTYLE